MNPVITTIQGGLGNQLFQYFAARYVASRRGGGQVLCDTAFYHQQHRHDGFQEINRRRFELGAFSLPLQFCTPFQRLAWRLGVSHKARGIWKSLFGWWPGSQVVPVREGELTLEQAVTVSDIPWLLGTWQDCRPLEEIRELVEAGMVSLQPLGAGAAAVQAAIQAAPSAVCVHVRRGDYVNKPASTLLHGVMPADYFKAGMKHVLETVTDAHFFLFSDDPAWAAEHVSWPGRTTVVEFASTEGRRDLEEFALMRSCRHFVISNSTFSWWPAWLDAYPGKIVVAPQKWFADGRDVPIVPATWVRL